jgi:hypothetical protein
MKLFVLMAMSAMFINKIRKKRKKQQKKLIRDKEFVRLGMLKMITWTVKCNNKNIIKPFTPLMSSLTSLFLFAAFQE